MGMTFLDVLRDYNVATAPEGHHHVTRGYVQFDCPFCSPGTGRYRMGYNLNYHYCNCWTCGAHRTVDVLVELTGLPLAQVAPIFAQIAEGGPAAIYQQRTQPRGRLELPRGIGPLARPHREYLKGRGFDPDELARLWGIQGIGIHESLGWRIFIPITHRGEVVSWTTRSLQETGRRYMSAPAKDEKVSAKEVLYGADYARHAIVIHEGPADVWRVGPGAVATFGLGYSRAQLALMAAYPIRVVCFDNEPAAQRQAQKLVRELKDFEGKTKHVILESAKDAAAASQKEIRELRKELFD